MRSHPCDACGIAIQTCAVMHASNYSCCDYCDHEEGP